MKSLPELLLAVEEIENFVAANEGEIPEEAYMTLAQTREELQAKTESWIYMLTEKIERDIEYLKTIKEQVQKEIKTLENKKKRSKTFLNKLMKAYGLSKLQGITGSIVAYNSVTHAIDESKLTAEDKQYSIENLTYQQVQKIKSVLGEDIRVKEKVPNVSDLPVTHPAIVEIIEPSVKIYLKRQQE